jgi:GntR family histidine utilization transcriptional repressor
MKNQGDRKAIPAYQQIKDYVLAQIHAGNWNEGDAIPAEEAVAQTFKVSRMTANRALRELAADQVLIRVQGSGTYVAPRKYQATLIEIKNIAQEIEARGHRHRSELHLLERCKASAPLAVQFEVEAGHALFHSTIVHLENGVPIQVEDRWVNSAVAPDYLQQDFGSTTPNEYLMRVAPLQGVRYSLEAQTPPRGIAEMLKIPMNEPCLLLKRRTLTQGLVASTATMWHPGSRYQFTGSF